MGGRGRVAPGGGRENYRAAASRRGFQRSLARAAGGASDVPSMTVHTHTAGGTSSTTTLHADARVAAAAGVTTGPATRSVSAERAGVSGPSIGRVVRQPDGRYRAEVHVAGARPRYFRSGSAAREHIIGEVRSRAEARVGGAVPLAHGVARGGAVATRAAGRASAAVTAARREGTPMARRFSR